jgi:diadenylate cyclase
VFKDGEYEDRPHEELGGHWRINHDATAANPGTGQESADSGLTMEGGDAGLAADQAAEDPLVTEHARTDELVNRLADVAESLSATFDRWEEQYVSGPSLYFVIVADANYEEYTDPLGANTWPTDICRVVTQAIDRFVTAVREVAFSCDGAVVIMTDGTVQEQMVRVRSPSATEVERRDAFDYAGWMGTKHLSAVEISNQEEILAAVTLSEEDGRVTVFRDGSYQDRRREELGGRWRDNR